MIVKKNSFSFLNFLILSFKLYQGLVTVGCMALLLIIKLRIIHLEEVFQTKSTSKGCLTNKIRASREEITNFGNIVNDLRLK